MEEGETIWIASVKLAAMQIKITVLVKGSLP